MMGLWDGIPLSLIMGYYEIFTLITLKPLDAILAGKFGAFEVFFHQVNELLVVLGGEGGGVFNLNVSLSTVIPCRKFHYVISNYVMIESLVTVLDRFLTTY